MNPADVESFLQKAFSGHEDAYAMRVEFDAEGVAVRLPYREDHQRPGGTVAGPVLMMLADTAMLALLFSRIGPDAEYTATSHLNMVFLRRPPQADLRAVARPLRMGRRQFVADVQLFSTGEDPVAQATVTYARLPHPDREGT